MKKFMIVLSMLAAMIFSCPQQTSISFFGSPLYAQSEGESGGGTTTDEPDPVEDEKKTELSTAIILFTVVFVVLVLVLQAVVL